MPGNGNVLLGAFEYNGRKLIFLKKIIILHLYQTLHSMISKHLTDGE